MYQQAIFKLCQGTPDKEAGSYVLNSLPASNGGAFDKMRWFHYNHQAIYGRGPRKEFNMVGPERGWNTRSERGEPPQVCVTEEGGGKANRAPCKYEIERQDGKIEELKTLIINTASPPRFPVSRSPSPTSRGSNCFYCQQEGHFKRECLNSSPESPKPKSVSFSNKRLNRSRDLSPTPEPKKITPVGKM